MMGDTHDRLVACLYRGVAEPHGWNRFLREACGAFGFQGAIIGAQRHGRGAGFVAYTGLDPGLTHLFLERYTDPRTNPVVRELSRYPLVTAIPVPDALGGLRRMQRTDFYSEILRPQGLRGGIIGLLAKGPGGIASISFLTDRTGGGLDRRTVNAIERLLPHVGTAVHIFLHQLRLRRHMEDEHRALDCVGSGLISTDPRARVLTANRAAAAVLAAGDGLRLHAGRLATRAPRDTVRLLACIAGVAQGAHGALGAALAVARRSGLRPYAVQVLPLVASDSLVGGPDGARVVVSVVDPERHPAPPARRLVDLYRLTPAEARLAVGLAEGERLGEIAAQRGVRMPTLRSQLSAVLRKTETARQSELVALVTRLGIAGPA